MAAAVVAAAEDELAGLLGFRAIHAASNGSLRAGSGSPSPPQGDADDGGGA